MSERPEQTQDGISLVDSAIADYLEKLDHGEQVDRLAFLNNYPGLADELSSFFADIDDVDHLVGCRREKDSSSHVSEVSAHIPPAAYSIDTSRIAGYTPSLATPTEPVRSVPQVIGRYQILRRLGEGGMGAVYLARDMLLSRSVALKIPHTAVLDEPGRRERFLREAQAAAHLHHPNICQVFDAGETDGIPYITMAYVEGVSLASQLAEWRQFLPPRDAVTLVSKIAAALEEAHSHGIVHRDLKPANIMINQRNEPVIMDFGLALQINEGNDPRVTKPGTVMGTPAYMSPEQITGDPSAVGAATDIYSLGVILFEFLAGRLPFQGSAAEIMVHVLKDDAPLPSSLRPDVDSELDAICQRMLSKRIEDRYPNMATVAAVLKRYLRSSRSAVESGCDSVLELPIDLGENGEIPPTVTIGNNAHAKKTSVKSRKQVWGLVAASLTSVILLVAGIAAVTGSIGKDQNLVKFDVDETVPSDLEVRIDGKRIELSDLNNGIHLEPGSEHSWAIWRGDDAMLWNEDFSVTKDENPAIKVTLRHDPAQGTKFGSPPPAAPVFVRKLPFADDVIALATSPDGTTLAVASGNTVLLWDSAKDVEICRITPAEKGEISALAFDSSGNRLAVGGKSQVRVFDPVRGKEDRILDYKGTVVNSLVYSRDGRWLAASSRGGNIAIWSVSDQYDPREFTDSKDAESLAFSPDNLTLASAHRDGKVVIRDVNSLKIKQSLAIQGSVIHSMTFSPNGKLIATGDSLGGIRFWELENGTEIKSLRGHTSDVRSLMFSSNGRFLASGSSDRTFRIWDVATAVEIHVIRQEMEIHSVFIDNSSQMLLSAGKGKEIRFWQLPVSMTLPIETGLLAKLEDHLGFVESVHFSPNGKLLVSAGANDPTKKEIDSHVRLWDVATQKLIRRFDSKVRRITKVQFSSDGQLVAAMSERGEFQFWDVTSGARTQDFGGVGFGTIGAGRIRDFDFVPGREQLVVVGSEGHMIVRINDLKIISSWKDGDLGVHSVAAYSDSRATWILSGSAPRLQNAADLVGQIDRAGKVTLWEMSLLKPAPPLKAPGLQVSLLKLTPDGRYALGGAGGSFVLWDLDIRVRENRQLQNWSSYAQNVGAISHDGNRVLLAAPGKSSALVLLDVASGDVVQEFHPPDGRSVVAAAFSPDGQLAASGGDGNLILWRLPEYVDPERRAAEWILKTGGRLTERNTVLQKGLLSDVRDLPEGKIECLTVVFHDNQTLTDEDLKRFAGLRSLGELDLKGTRITNQGLMNLHGLPRLNSIRLPGTFVTDEGLAHLAQLPDLNTIDLSQTKVTGKGLQNLIGMGKLSALVLTGTQITDNDLIWLKGFPKLEQLYLGKTPITDEGLKHLKSLKELRLLDHEETSVTPAGIRDLQQSLPLLRVAHY